MFQIYKSICLLFGIIGLTFHPLPLLGPYCRLLLRVLGPCYQQGNCWVHCLSCIFKVLRQWTDYMFSPILRVLAFFLGMVFTREGVMTLSPPLIDPGLPAPFMVLHYKLDASYQLQISFFSESSVLPQVRYAGVCSPNCPLRNGVRQVTT